jgi:hypothetical protein
MDGGRHGENAGSARASTVGMATISTTGDGGGGGSGAVEEWQDPLDYSKHFENGPRKAFLFNA